MAEIKNDLFASNHSEGKPKDRHNQRAEIIRLSPTSLNLFLECPRCFWLQVNKNIKRPGIPVATITTGLDRVVKEYCNLYRDKGILPPILASKVPGKLIRNFPIKGWLEFIDHKIEARLGGYLDECLDLGDNRFAALDHKTRGSKPETTHRAHQFQMDVYTFLLEENGFLTKKLAYLIYYIPKAVISERAFEFEALAIEVQTDPQRARSVLQNAVSMLKQSIPSPSQDCGFCKWTITANL